MTSGKTICKECKKETPSKQGNPCKECVSKKPITTNCDIPKEEIKNG